MPEWQGKRRVEVVTAYIRPDGLPDFALNEAHVTQEEYANGVHYAMVDAILDERGFDETRSHFDEFEAPAFLFPAVRNYLEVTPGGDPELVFPF